MPAAPAPTIPLEKRGRTLGREQRKLAAIVAADVVGCSEPRVDKPRMGCVAMCCF
jgi:hypothetical protein